jgi:type IV pilus assembly protein PilW
VFVSSKRSYSTQDRLSRLQENARFAIQFLTRDIRMAGYSGCAKDIVNTNNTLNNSASFLYAATVPLEGIDNAAGTWSPSTLASGLTNMKSNTDAIAIRSGDSSLITPVSSIMQSETDSISVTSAANFNKSDIIMIADCSNADVFQVTSNNSTSPLAHGTGGAAPGNATQTLSKAYDTAAKVMKFHTHVYYIKSKTDGTPALYMQDNGTDQELVEGVENLQVTYGVDTDTPSDGIPNVYLRAGENGLTTAAQWASIKSIRIGMLVRTSNDKDADIDIRSTYDVNGYTFNVPAGDRYQRRVFLTTIQVRNM